MKDWAERLKALTLEGGRDYREGGGPFPERLPQLIVVGNFLSAFAEMVLGWADWALEVLGEWPEFPRLTDPKRAVLAAVLSEEASVDEGRRRVVDALPSTATSTKSARRSR